MDYFKRYVSNTLGEGANQFFFLNENEERETTGRVYYRIFKGGRLEYSLLYSNIIDSTYSDGTVSHSNLICDSWTITGLKVGKVTECSMETAFEPEEMQQLFFDGKISKEVAPGEFFHTDPFWFEAKSGDFMCIEISFKGKMIPYHEEIQKPVFVKNAGRWGHDQKLPVPGMVGCARDVACRIAYLGDSITQGIGATPGSYRHWNALTAEALGDRYSFWNLGIGFARAHDASSGGAWLFKAKQADLVVVCLGVNDLLRGLDHRKTMKDIKSIVEQLQQAGCKVILQSLPPAYEEKGQDALKWLEVYDYVRRSLAPMAEGYFDPVPYICRTPDKPYQYKCELHPNDTGCRAWADALIPYLKGHLEALDE